MLLLEEMELYILLAISLVGPLSSAQIYNEPDTFNENMESDSYRWEKILWPTKELPTDAVLGGADSPKGCGMVYVGRAWYKKNLLPAKICGSDGRAFVTYNGAEVMLNESELLCAANVLWKPMNDEEIPPEALQGGETENGEELYIGRGFVGTLLTPGKVEGGSKTLFMTFDQKVYTALQYEILLKDL